MRNLANHDGIEEDAQHPFDVEGTRTMKLNPKVILEYSRQLMDKNTRGFRGRVTTISRKVSMKGYIEPPADEEDEDEGYRGLITEKHPVRRRCVTKFATRQESDVVQTQSSVTPIHSKDITNDNSCKRNQSETLLDHGTNNGRDAFTAEKSHNVDILNLTALFEQGFLVDDVDEMGITLLHISAYHDESEVLDFLVNRGANVNATSSEGWTPLHMAFQKGHLRIARKLMSYGADINILTIVRSSSLHIAARGGYLGCVKLILEAGVNGDLRDLDGATALHFATHFGHTDCVRLLLESKVDVNSLTNEEETPLHVACREGHLDCLRILLEHGAMTDVPNTDGFNPLHEAALHGNTDCLRVLLDLGSSDTDLIALLHISAEINNAECVDMLIKRGVDVNALNADRLSALHISALKGATESLKVLLRAGALIDLQGEAGFTALMLALEEDEVESARLLLESSADATVRQDEGMNAFHVAADLGRVEGVRLMLKAGVDVDALTACKEGGNQPGGKGRLLTALDLARRKSHMECVDMLLKSGARSSSDMNKV
ncbi:unnamed protein product [Timema podura]|uniref:Uncharacterized protein n=1 Tax=Timema podura TaxID=61482 RepID=A0ABN7NYX9_TIMPD|nr:unnamed protein product [Timema podura]